jgi:hypothetical protein
MPHRYKLPPDRLLFLLYAGPMEVQGPARNHIFLAVSAICNRTGRAGSLQAGSGIASIRPSKNI